MPCASAAPHSFGDRALDVSIASPFEAFDPAAILPLCEYRHQTSQVRSKRVTLATTVVVSGYDRCARSLRQLVNPLAEFEGPYLNDWSLSAHAFRACEKQVNFERCPHLNRASVRGPTAPDLSRN